MPRKSYALEASLITLAVVVAFCFQLLLNSSKPPVLPPSAEQPASQTSDSDNDFSSDPVDDKEPTRPRAPEKVYNPHLSDLAQTPDWTRLDAYQGKVSRSEFTELLHSVYTIGGTWSDWVTIEDHHAIIRTDAENSEETYTFSFAKKDDSPDTPPRYWRSREEIPEGESGRPLEGIRIAIDPGHIGGNFAAIEERRMSYKDYAPVQEGNLTLTTAQHLQNQLETLGADVTLVRQTTDPVNPFRPEDYYPYAKSKLEQKNQIVTPESVQRVADKLFYRTGEVRSRAFIVNKQIKPDITVCLHFNAEDWGDPENPTLRTEEHFHLILNGAYTAKEVAHDDERLLMMVKIAQGIHREEAAISHVVARAFTRHTDLPPYLYQPNSKRAVNIDGNPYLWGRNLLANRVYECPVIYCEPYLMNGEDTHERIQMGDYEGLRFVNGLLRPSIYREYTNAVTEGLVEYYSRERREETEEEEEESAES